MNPKLRALADQYIRQMVSLTPETCHKANLFFYWLRPIVWEAEPDEETATSTDQCYFKSYFNPENQLLVMEFRVLEICVQAKAHILGLKYPSGKSTAIWQMAVTSMAEKLLTALEPKK